MADTILEVKHLKKYFKTGRGMLHAVDDINFTLERGKTLGLVGESGCGKSTTGRVILRLLEPTSGEIIFEGKDISRIKGSEMRHMRKDLQIIFQDPFSSLDPKKTVSQIIAEPIKENHILRGKHAIEERVLELMDTPEDVLPYAVEYLRIYSIGMPVIMVYNFGSAILRCIGDTRRPLYCLTLSGVINAILNIIMVVVFHLDVAGVAIATVASNAVSAGLVWHFLTHEESEIRLDARKLRIDTGDMKRIMAIGLPAGLQSMVFSVSNVIIQSVLNGFGTNAVAGSAVALNYENFTYFVVSAFCQAVVTFTSQNFGAGQYRRCNRIFRLSMLFAVISAIIMSWAFILGRGFFTSVFTDDPEVGRYARLRICIVLGLYFVLCSYEISGSALRGLGHSLTPAVLTVFGTCVFRLFWVWVVCRIWPRFDVLLAVYPISWVITGTAVLSAYFIMRDKAYRMHHALSPQL